MSRPLPTPALLVMVLVAAVAAGGLLARAQANRTAAADRPVQRLTPDQRAGTLTFAPEIHPVDRRVVLDAIARARPEARRLVDLVDGAVTVKVQAAGPGRAGWTQPGPRGYEVVLDLAGVSQQHGERGIDRLVLHELAHVIDHALVPGPLAARLDAAIPRGYECGAGECAGAAREERFAESFAKWATGDIGADLYIGYRVPPPAPLEEWGRPLATLG